MRRFIIGNGSHNYGNEVTGIIPHFPEPVTLMSKSRGRCIPQLRKKVISPLSTFLFCWAFNGLNNAPPTSVKAVFFTGSTDSNANLFHKHPHRYT